MLDDLGMLNDFAADEPDNDLSSRLDLTVSEPMEPGVVDAPLPNLGVSPPVVIEPMEPGVVDAPLPNLGVSPPVVIEPMEPGDAAPLPGVDPGDHGELPPGTIFPIVSPTTSGGGRGGMVISAQPLATFADPPHPRPKWNCPAGDFVTFTAGSSALTVTVYNGFVGGEANTVMLQKTVNPGDLPVKHPGCFTHWKAIVAEGGYTAVGQMDGIPFAFQ